MKARRVLAVARKEILHVLRDPRSLLMAIAIPVLFLILYGYALTLDVDNVPTVVWDQSRSLTSRDFISRFQASRYFKVVRQAESYRALEEEIDAGRALLGLVIPTDFARRLDSSRGASVQLIADASDSTTANLAIGYAETITLIYSQEITLHTARRAGGLTQSRPVDLRPQVWFNRDLESKNFIIPGLIAVILMVIAAMLTSLTVAREWERGTMEQLISTPVKGSELILGKLIPYFAVGMLDMMLAVLMGQFLFHVPLRGSVTLLFGTAAIFLAGGLALGILLSIVTRSQLLANQIALVATFLPAFLLSGFVFPIGNMPLAIQLFTYLIPARYFVTVLKAIYLKGVGLEVLLVDVLLLSVFAVVVIGLANLRFRKKLV